MKKQHNFYESIDTTLNIQNNITINYRMVPLLADYFPINDKIQIWYHFSRALFYPGQVYVDKGESQWSLKLQNIDNDSVYFQIINYLQYTNTQGALGDEQTTSK